MPIDSSLRSKAAAQAAHRRARRPRARLSAGPYTLLECKAVTTRLAKLSGLGLASWPAYNSLRREAAAQAAYRRARRLLPITRCDGRTAAHRQPTAA